MFGSFVTSDYGLLPRVVYAFNADTNETEIVFFLLYAQVLV